MMKTAKVVSFGEISERFIPDMNLTIEEQRSLWFTRKQMRKFRRQAETDENCNESVRISAARYNQRRNYVRYVLRIQAYNKSIGMDDPTGLGAVAVALSKNAMENARFRADKDAAEVMTINEQDEGLLQQQQQQQKDLYTTETETDAKRPGCQTRRSHVSINAPKRNRTAANMA